MIHIMTANEPQHQLSPLQQKILELYKEIKVILDRHHLRYYALGGTCIGAVRHRGFIPWDDDLDIMLPDRDYYRFLEICQTELPRHLELILSYERPHCSSLEAKVHDKRTTLIENHELCHPDEYKGVFIDIFKMTGAPEDENERRKFCKKLVMYKRFNEKRRLDFKNLTHPRSKLMWIAVFPLRLLPYRFWSQKIIRMTDKYPYDNSTYVARSWDSQLWRFMMKREEIYGTPVELPFEDTVIPCPQNYDLFLTTVFGDYMQLPPQEEQVAAHSDTGFLDLDRPYTYYQEQYRRNGRLKKD